MPISGVILAAGTATRMGRPKLLLPWGQATVLDQTLSVATAVGLAPLVLVSGAEREQTESIAARFGVASTYNADFAAGQSGSLRVGLAAVPAHQPVMFLLADQPSLQVETLHILMRAADEHPGRIIVPRDEAGQAGNPRIFPPQLLSRLRELSGDRGGRAMLDGHPQLVRYVDVADPAITRDMDTWEEYQQLRQAAREAGE